MSKKNREVWQFDCPTCGKTGTTQRNRFPKCSGCETPLQVTDIIKKSNPSIMVIVKVKVRQTKKKRQ
ncbi:MAG: hypothetical protein COW72_02675 [Candidatus Nealsonbacteria bacterium CG18_big_fil_WC_8_21_14_2_50_37_10]|uniref:Uncharacterized protein n=2 Tax=Candidatus Nealsoniibacteriota TaxID=1817911 RepID=A0A2H0FFS8_9BACT|nr:MAG: hypothetical protein COW72_02675 [Candidatus Nealsonbacteria bacterium CG18_big_fil_WC_8_21_14_2_50_37_10]PIR72546.1 MAG: hypothetical protein COU41_00095 [Candidatus Nealsonbacteria bacterium CG10_big_fil_rev_8_21_14_0_10_36_228]